MAGTKYDKYFITYDPAHWENKIEPRSAERAQRMIARLDDTVVKGSFFYLVHWEFPRAAPKGAVGHPPHIHKHAELLFHIGTNPEDPMDLGAECEIYMGKEMERHVITKSCVVFIPPNFIHAPWRPLRTERPWIFIEVNQGPSHTEKLFAQILPEEMLEEVNNNPDEKMKWARFKDGEEGF